MRTFILIPILLSLMSWGYAKPVEVLENGGFTKKSSYWGINRHNGYGDDGKLKISNKVFSAKGLRRGGTWYLGLNQPVNIRKDVKYKLKFDVMQNGEGKLYVSIGHPKKTVHGKIPPFQATPAWKTHELEFTGKFDTDLEWFEFEKARYAESKIEKGMKTKQGKGYAEKVKREDPATRSTLRFGLGDLKGDIQLRNISIVELK